MKTIGIFFFLPLELGRKGVKHFSVVLAALTSSVISPLNDVHAFFYNNSSLPWICSYDHLRSAFCEIPPPMKDSRPLARAV